MRGVDIGYFFTCAEFVVVRPLRSHIVHLANAQDFQRLDVTGGFEELIDAIVKAERSDGMLEKIVNRLVGFRSSFDQKGKFASSDELLSAAYQLNEVSAVWLPDWNFDSDSIGYGP